MAYDVVGFGNTVLDITVNVDDEFLVAAKIPKNNFVFINNEQSEELKLLLKGKETIIYPGGSVSNTIAGIALLGGNSAYIGGCGDDSFGRDYKKNLNSSDASGLFISKEGMTGHCFTFITPDKERSFAVNLGECNYISPTEVKLDFKTRFVHIEGYKLEHEVDFPTIIELCKYAKSIGAKVSCDVNDAGLIKRMGSKLLNFLTEYVDVIFMNEEEAEALTSFSDERALDFVENYCEMVILKLGPKGSSVRLNNQTEIISAKRVETVVNTNGAGDAYAAGFLYGLTQDFNISRCGKIGSAFSAEVVMRESARVFELTSDIKELIDFRI